MALNREYAEARSIPMAVSPGTESGDALVIEDLPCVALTDRDDDGFATVQTDGAFRFAVASAAISAGEIVYLHEDQVINVTSDGGKRFGYALTDSPNGSTDEIPIKIGY